MVTPTFNSGTTGTVFLGMLEDIRNLYTPGFEIGIPTSQPQQRHVVTNSQCQCKQDPSSSPLVALRIKSFEETFPSLLSIIKDIPKSILINFSMTNSSLTARNKYLEDYINRLNRISRFPSVYLKENPTKLPFFDLILELSNWITKEQFVRSAMRILVNKWLYKRSEKRMLNDNDPWTLYPPINCIRIVDIKSRGVYQFEASSIKNHIENALGYSQWLFSNPYAPKNPLTNIAFHEGQLTTIIESLRKYGYGSWMIEAYKASNWNLKTFRIDNSTQLKLYSVKQIVKSSTDELCELLEDFIDDQFEEHGLELRKKKKKVLIVIKWGVRTMLVSPYMQKWVLLFHDYYKLKFRYSIISSDDILLNFIYVRSMQLFDNHEAISSMANKRLAMIQKSLINVNSNTIHHFLPIQLSQEQIELQDILNSIIGQIAQSAFLMDQPTEIPSFVNGDENEDENE